MNRSYSKIRHIQESNIRLEKRLLFEGNIDDMLSEMEYSNIDSVFKKKKYTRNDNPKLTGIYKPIAQYTKDFNNNVKVIGIIFEQGGPTPEIKLINMELPDFSDCADVKIHSMTKTINITNENIDCVLNTIDGDVFEKKFLNKKD